MVVHTHGAPQEGDEIAEREACIEDEIAEDRKPRAAHHMVAQFTLRILQLVDHDIITLQCLDDHPVLHRFLKYTLYTRVAVAYLTSELSHLPDIQFTD